MNKEIELIVKLKYKILKKNSTSPEDSDIIQSYPESVQIKIYKWHLDYNDNRKYLEMIIDELCKYEEQNYK